MSTRRHASIAVALLALAGCDATSAPGDAGLRDASDLGAALPDRTPGDAGPGCSTDASALPDATDILDNAVLPDLRFSTGDGELSLRDGYAPCAPPRLLVIRAVATWSGPSRWQAAHTRALRARPGGDRLTVLDLLVLGQDDLPAAPRDLAPWRALYDAPPDALALDPSYVFRTLYFGGGQLPVIVLADTRTMRTMRVLIGPTADALDGEITAALAALDGLARPHLPSPSLYDGRFTRDQWDMIRAMAPAPSPPPDPTNAYADDPRAAALGTALFTDTGLSPSGRVACATCHQPDRAFTDGLPRAMGVSAGDRNTPSVLSAAYNRWQFWDGRADTLWSQALGPCENPAEMASSRLWIAHAVARSHGADYATVFGPLPDLGDTRRFPSTGRPGDPAWDAMADADRAAVDRVFVNVGKSLAAYERTLRTAPTALDAYAAGQTEALTPRARDGLQRFFEVGCIQCHWGPLLTDQSFHNIQMPTGRQDGAPDIGRLGAVDPLRASIFLATGAFSDAPGAPDPRTGLDVVEAMRGQFKTPSLRGVARTGPWGHGGTFATLTEVLNHYSQRHNGVPVTGTTGTEDPHLAGFHHDDQFLGSMVDFLQAMDPLPAP